MPELLELKYIEAAENPNLLRSFDLKTKCIISGITLMNKLCGIVVYTALKS